MQLFPSQRLAALRKKRSGGKLRKLENINEVSDENMS
jgi:hypothetical protein